MDKIYDEEEIIINLDDTNIIAPEVNRHRRRKTDNMSEKRLSASNFDRRASNAERRCLSTSRSASNNSCHVRRYTIDRRKNTKDRRKGNGTYNTVFLQ